MLSMSDLFCNFVVTIVISNALPDAELKSSLVCAIQVFQEEI